MRAVLFLSVVLASIHGSKSDLCTSTNIIDGSTSYMSCFSGCCGTSYTRYCCTGIETINYISSSATQYTGMSGAVTAGIVVGVIGFIATVVGIILCCVCCAKAASGTTARGRVIHNPGPQVAVITQGTTNTAYAPLQYAAYPVSPYGQTTTQVKY